MYIFFFSKIVENSQLWERHIKQLKQDIETLIEEETQREQEMDNLIKKQHFYQSTRDRMYSFYLKPIQKKQRKILSVKTKNIF